MADARIRVGAPAGSNNKVITCHDTVITVMCAQHQVSDCTYVELWACQCESHLMMTAQHLYIAGVLFGHTDSSLMLYQALVGPNLGGTECTVQAHKCCTGRRKLGTEC
jgi:hypothetical protein